MKRELSNQELLDRYIHSVKLLLMLPADKMDDIAAEITSNLQSLVDDRESELGRELSRDELSAILKQHGHPMQVAARYRDRPARGLIGPEVFPLYWFTLRAIFAFWVTIRVIVTVFEFQGAATAGSILLRFGRDVLLAGVIIGAGVTLLFAVMEYRQSMLRFSQRWKPESLPPIPPVPKPWQPRPVVQMTSGVVWLIFFGMALFVPGLFWVWGGRGVFSPSEAVYAMRLPMWLLAVFGVSLSWLGYTRFATAEWRRFLLTAVVAAGLALALFLLRGGDLLVAGPNWGPTQAKSLATLNQMISGVLVLACVFAGLLCLHELRRSVRRLGRDRQTA
jgi:hypothetical protein